MHIIDWQVLLHANFAHLEHILPFQVYRRKQLSTLPSESEGEKKEEPERGSEEETEH